MTKLSDTQLVVLSAACQRPDRNALPLPASLKGGAAQKVVGNLLSKGLIEESLVSKDQPVWREGNAGNRFTLLATDAALEALGIEVEGTGGEKASSDAGTAAAARKRGSKGKLKAKPAPAPKRKPAAERSKRSAAVRRGKGGSPARTDSKQARLIEMLKQRTGASLEEIMAATSWQAHTVRGAIAGALKKKLGLTIESEKDEKRGRVYRIRH